MTDIILATPILRTKNIIDIAKNIAVRFKDDPDFRPVWLLCFDKYNAQIDDLSIKRIEVACLERNIEYHIYYQGDKGKANYGGTLMNEPLRDIKEKKYKNSNPLVYVLDDDNIIHSNFLNYLRQVALDNDKTIWLNMLDEFGSHRFVRNADRLAACKGTGVNNGYVVIHPCASCDPSQLVIRLNRLLDLGGFGHTHGYDYEFMNVILSNTNDIEKSMVYQGDNPWLRENGDFYMTCYHNGLITKDILQEALADCEKEFQKQKEDSYIRIHTANKYVNIPISNKEVIKILKDKINEIQ